MRHFSLHLQPEVKIQEVVATLTVCLHGELKSDWAPKSMHEAGLP